MFNIWVRPYVVGDFIQTERVAPMVSQKVIKVRERARLHAKQHPLEVVYRGMMQRCGHWKYGNKREWMQKRYEYRGIKVCEEWRHGFRKFEEWALSHGWQRGLQIDRIDNNGDYSPSNCRFVTPKENSNNRSTSVSVYYQGEMIKLTDFIEIAKSKGINPNTVRARIRLGWSIDEIISIKNGRKYEREGRRMGNPRFLFEYKGKIFTISQLAKLSGLSKSATYNRLVRRKMKVEQLFSIPKRTHK